MRHQYRNPYAALLWGALVALATQCAPDADEHFRKGQTYIEISDWDAAAPELEKAVAKDSTNLVGWYNLAQCYTNMQEIDKAVGAYERLVTLDPTHQYALANLGVMYSGMERLDDAERVLQKCMTLYPQFGQPYVNLGTISAKRGDWDKAFYYFKEAQRRGVNEPQLEQQIQLARDIVQGRIPAPVYRMVAPDSAEATP